MIRYLKISKVFIPDRLKYLPTLKNDIVYERPLDVLLPAPGPALALAAAPDQARVGVAAAAAVTRHHAPALSAPRPAIARVEVEL